MAISKKSTEFLLVYNDCVPAIYKHKNTYTRIQKSLYQQSGDGIHNVSLSQITKHQLLRWQVAKIHCAIRVTLCILSQGHLNGIDLNQKIASSQDFIAVPTMPGLPMLRQHVPKLPGLHNEFMHIVNFLFQMPLSQQLILGDLTQ